MLFSTIVLASSILSGCSSSSSSGASSQENYNGPGSKWDLSLTGGATGNFNIDHFQTEDLVNPDYNVKGTYIRQSSGFVTLIVTEVTSLALMAH